MPSIIVFEKDKGANFKEVRHYNLITGDEVLSEKLNISINRGFSKAHYVYCLKIREGKKWSKQITGLYPTADLDVFYGDTQDKKNMVWFKFQDDKLKVLFFPNFYTRRITDFLNFLKDNY